VSERPAPLPPLTWAELDARHLPEIVALHRTALATLADPTFVKPEQPSFFAGILDGRGRIIGARARAGAELGAYGVFQRHLAPDDDPSARLGLGGARRLAKIAGAAVAPALRGHRLQCELVRRRAAFARAEGFSDLYATAAPGNVPSWRNLLTEGFAVVGIEARYGTLVRYLLHRALDAPAAGAADGTVWCGLDSLARQRELLAAGHRGVACRPGTGGACEIGFAVPAG
jgi:ribosomal protein S18 acetylase RimI-like enzyme